MFGNISTVLFDLDGTLYQDYTFYKQYLYYATAETRFETDLDKITGFVKNTILCEGIPLNRFYRLDTPPVEHVADLQDALEKRLLDDSPETYVLARNLGKVCYLGDMWALVQLVAGTLGLLTPERRDEIFLRTRGYMAEKGLVRSQRLIDAVKALRPRYRTLLMSNSFESTSIAFLRLLGYDPGLFDFVVYDAGKPFQMLDSLKRVMPGILCRPERLLSIGDHAFNDLMQIKAIGGMTAWINPFVCAKTPRGCDVVLHTTDELAFFLERELVSADGVGRV